MSRHHHDNRRRQRRRPSPTFEYTLGSQSFDSTQAYHEDTCRIPYPEFNLAKSPRKTRIFVLCPVWFGLIAAVGFLSFNVVYTVLAVVARPATTDINSPDFTLYKNSQFETCVNSSPEQVNCTLLEADLHDSRYPDLSWIGKQRDQYFITGPEYQVSASALDPMVSWCDLASCMAGWKIVPSIVRDSALGLTVLKAWSFLLITAITVFWDLRGILSPPKTCKRGGFIDWTLLVWKAGQLGFWWWAYATFVRNPTMAEPVSLVGWISTWALAVNFSLHPWACYFSLDSSIRRSIVIALNITTFVQWSATLHALQQQNGRDSIQKYDCLSSSIASAPGSSLCAAEQLCSKRWLFSNPDFTSENTETATVFYMIAVYYAIVTYPIYLFLSAASTAIRRWFPDMIGRLWVWFADSEDSDRAGLQMFRLALFGLFGYLGLSYSIPFFTSPDFKVDFHENSSWSTLAYDSSCRAVHVGISPTYAYLDINAFARNVRIAKALFNAG
ncbi:hypothetical protein GQX73_g6835 [Xylaria multiplex]|uniref:Uncharacterized protein n=1 Tax=Xylaria multiplex TaxID=323545 RepID=A0A7C8ILW8_9PEZI|nr:hypothetical protein GQX73_g6835 [Xylaria multiplex]